MFLHKQFVGGVPSWADDILGEGENLQKKVNDGAEILQTKRGTLKAKARESELTVKQRQELLVYKLLNPTP